MLTEQGETPENQKAELTALIQKRREIDQRLLALVRFLARRAAIRDHALQLNIEKAADNSLQKGNT